MEKLNVICYINSAGFNVNYENVKDTVLSIDKNINTNYKFYITTDKEEHKTKILNIFDQNNISSKLINIEVSDESWANCFNNFFEKVKNQTDYILMSHDDLIVRTYDFFNITMQEISGYEDELGWIGFTSDSYYRLHGNPVCQSAREVFSKDRASWPSVFEVNKMKGGSYDESKLEMPKRTCKVPGIFPHFNLIKTTNLEKIGPCPNWGRYTLLIDEHWSLMTLIKNLWTVWVPNVFYDHPIRYHARPIQGLQGQHDTMLEFQKHWGIWADSLSDTQVEDFCKNYPNTNISFFNDKNSFDYQYLKS